VGAGGNGGCGWAPLLGGGGGSGVVGICGDEVWLGLGADLRGADCGVGVRGFLFVGLNGLC